MKLLKATNIIKNELQNAEYLTRHIWKGKNFIEFDVQLGDLLFTIYLRPRSDFRRFDAVGTHHLVESNSLESELWNSIYFVERDGFAQVHLYCLDDRINNKTERKNLLC